MPEGVKKVEVSTPLCWILARTLAIDEPNSVESLNALQDKYTLTPLSAWGDSELSNAPFERKYPQVDEDNPLDFYVLLNEMLRINPPRPADEGLVAMFKEIGLHPSQQFDLNNIDEATKKGLLRAIKDAEMIVGLKAKSVAEIINGWLVLPGPKEFGTDYLYRAALESFALLHGESEMTVGYLANFDGEGKLLDGDNSSE